MFIGEYRRNVGLRIKEGGQRRGGGGKSRRLAVYKCAVRGQKPRVRLPDGHRPRPPNVTATGECIIDDEGLQVHFASVLNLT